MGITKNQAFWYIVGMVHAKAHLVPEDRLRFSFPSLESGKNLHKAFQLLSCGKVTVLSYKHTRGKNLPFYRITSYSGDLVRRVSDACGDFNQVPVREDFFGETYLKGVFDGGFAPYVFKRNLKNVGMREIPYLDMYAANKIDYLFSLQSFLLDFKIKSSVIKNRARINIIKQDSLDKCVNFFSDGEKKEKLVRLINDYMETMRVDRLGRAQKMKRQFRQQKTEQGERAESTRYNLPSLLGMNLDA